MPITNACCCLCGGPIIDQSGQPLWMAQFHAIYSLEENKEAGAPAYLSGPGRREQLSDVVQAALPEHATDENGLINIGLLRAVFRDLAVFPIDGDPVITTQAWGFPFHSACWEILSHFSHPMPSDIQALLKLCRSFPSRQGLLNWGHDYGGSVDYETIFAPGEEPSLCRSTGSFSLEADPFNIPEIHLAFQQIANNPNSDPAGTTFRAAGTASADVFTRLPMEILSWILIYLPSGDVFSLKLASRVYANLALPESFWKSRFLPERELGYLFEAQEYFSSFKGCWRSIFGSVKALRSLPAILNRKRIWGLCSPFHEVLKTMRDINCDGDPIQSFFEPNVPSDDRCWTTASRALKLPAESFFTGSRVLYERKLILAPESTAILASTVDLFGRRYISGIRITDREGKSLSLGYRHADNEMLLLLQDNLQRQLRGFCLAQDQRGIRGLAIISDTGALSDWLGDHYDIPKRRLISNYGHLKAIDALKGGFDAVKLVSLSVPSISETEIEPCALPCPRDVALWHPDIPHPHLSFLGVSQLRHNADPYQELPICFQVFYCPQNERARNLTRITVRARGSSDALGDELGDLLSIGIGSTNNQGMAYFGLQDDKTKIERDFIIDESGGERITGLDTIYGSGQLLEFKIYTSHNRTGKFHLLYYEDLAPDYRETRSIRTEGKAVVGFWGMMSTWRGFSDIGLVCLASKTE